MNRRSFLRLGFAGTLAVVLRPVMPHVASVLEHRGPFDDINSITLKFIRSDPRFLDSIFAPSPLEAYLRSKGVQSYDGGNIIEESFTYTGEE